MAARGQLALPRAANAFDREKTREAKRGKRVEKRVGPRDH